MYKNNKYNVFQYYGCSNFLGKIKALIAFYETFW